MKFLLSILFFAFFLSKTVNCDRDERIIGGSAANIQDFPHTLGLRRFNAFICAASAIARLWAVSAATCFADGVNFPTQFTLRGGSTNREVGGFLFTVDLITVHPAFSATTQDFNVALARSTPIEGMNIARVPVAPSCATSCCSTCSGQAHTATGWGIDDTGTQPLTLRQITLPSINTPDCSNAWAQTFGLDRFCLVSDTQRGFCAGDLGNPTVANIGGTRVQTGIVIRWACGSTMQPSVVVRLENSSIRGWIEWVTGT